MARTVRDLITLAAQKLGINGFTSALSDNEMETALFDLNDLIEHLENDGMWFTSRQEYSLDHSQKDLSKIVFKRAGSLTELDGDIVVPKIPSRLASISYQLAQQWVPLAFTSADQLHNSTRLNIPIAYPNSYAYNTVDADTGIILLYPIPTLQTYQITVQDTKLDWGLDDVTDYPPGYDGYLVWAMASLLAKANGFDYATLEAEAEKRLSLIENRQVQQRMLRTSRSKGVYNVQSGLWSDGSSDFR